MPTLRFLELRCEIYTENHLFPFLPPPPGREVPLRPHRGRCLEGPLSLHGPHGTGLRRGMRHGQGVRVPGTDAGGVLEAGHDVPGVCTGEEQERGERERERENQ